MNAITTTYFNIDEYVPKDAGTWGWSPVPNNGRRITSRSDAEAKMVEHKAFLKELGLDRAPQLRIVEDVKTFTHASLIGYSDVQAFEIVNVISDKTLEIRRMDTEHDVSHLEFVKGGFCGTVINQQNQKVTYKSNPSAPVIRIRRKKNNPEAWTANGSKFTLGTEPYAFYDFNF